MFFETVDIVHFANTVSRINQHYAHWYNIYGYSVSAPTCKIYFIYVVTNILHGYFIVYSKAFIVTILCIMQRSRFLRRN